MRTIHRLIVASLLVSATVCARADGPLPVSPEYARPATWNPATNNLPAAAPAPRRDLAVQPATHQEPAVPLAVSPAGKTKSFGEHGASSLPGIFTMLMSLAFVLALFFLMTWMFRRGLPKGAVTLPSDVVEVLGRTSVAQRQYVHLIRVGSKLLLVSATPGGMDALTEITDPGEVDRLVGQCRAQQPHSVTGTFKQLLQQFGGDKTRPRPRAADAGEVSDA